MCGEYMEENVKSESLNKNYHKQIKDKKNEIGQKIYSLRIKNKMSQDQFADAIGKTTGKVISRWECGICKPSDESLLKIEKAFKVKLDEYYDNIEIKHKNKKGIVIVSLCLLITFLIILLLITNFKIEKMNIISADNDFSVSGKIYIDKDETEIHITRKGFRNTIASKCYEIEQTISINGFVVYKSGNTTLYEFTNIKSKPKYDLAEVINNSPISLTISSEIARLKNNSEIILDIACLKNENRDIERYSYKLKITK